MIHTENLTKKFGDRTAVEALTLDVNEGEVFGFLGPNGAGKTTTVRMLTTLIGPTAGTATVNKFRVGQDDIAIRRCTGILTETPGMYDRLSAEKNLTIFARLYEVADVKGQVEKYLRLLGLWDRRSDLVGNFSKGMKQKLAICRALLHEPAVVFLDEPTSGLDPEAARLVRDFIEEIKAQGRTIFLCTHNLDEADRLCDRIGVMKQRLITVDTPANLRQKLYGRKVVFHLRAADDALLARVRALPFVKEAQRMERKLVIGLDDPETHNPVLVRLLVEAGADVQFVGELRHSLEDVYLSLVGVSTD
ncbi:MAG TPA: ABC transporter ATP-binding protein [Anaerolineae bacterium]|nr:ABC transporter ATP-binding protein [Anaerolineae bacterium]HQI83046.1 ABC transporter ATP-binding protein [Anaerolineae bacterium]